MAIDKPGGIDDPKSKINGATTGQDVKLLEALNSGESDGEKQRNLLDRSENSEIPQGLRKFRDLWKRNVTRINRRDKEKMIEILERIPVNVEILEDGSRLVEIKFKTFAYKILDPNLTNHSDEKYKFRCKYKAISGVNRNEVTLAGIENDDENKWENQKLKEYVKKMQLLGLHIPKVEEMKTLLRRLYLKLDLPEPKDEEIKMEYAIAALMYLTGINGGYWLSMGNGESSENTSNWRSYLDWYGLGYVVCGYDTFYLLNKDILDSRATGNILMISCE